ncbi:Hypothetical protein EHI5A_058650 [Entamoeba histolytica KU27]|nr:Hypothetical protein EHI5A_058650 [Entamoeba histolytica KU27]
MNRSPTNTPIKKTWNKNAIKVSKKFSKLFQELRNESTKGELSEKSSIKLNQQLETMELIFSQQPYHEEIAPDDVGCAFINLLESSIDFLLRAENDDNTVRVYELIYKLVIFEGYQPYYLEEFPPERMTSGMINMFTGYHSALFRCALLLISSLSSSNILNEIKDQKDKLKVKKLTTFQFVITAPPLEEIQYKIVSKILSAISLRIPLILKDIFESVGSKQVPICRNLYRITVWDSFNKYCCNINKSCQRFSNGISGVDTKWTLHFAARLPFSYYYFVSFLEDLLLIFEYNSDQFVSVPGYSILNSLITHLSHGRISKISEVEMFYKTEALLCVTDYPTILNQYINDRLSRTNAYSIDSLATFVVSFQHIFMELNEKKIIIEDIEMKRIIQVLQAIVTSDSYYALTVMFSMIYELLPILNKKYRVMLITFIMDNFEHFFVHWYYQARIFFFKLIHLKMTLAPSFRINGGLLPEEIHKYDTYGDLLYDQSVCIGIEEKIRTLRNIQKHKEQLSDSEKKNIIYINQAFKEFDEQSQFLEQWKKSNSLTCPIAHLDLSLVSNLVSNLI